MHVPAGLEPLFEYGIVEEVVRPLMSGKEAQVYLVISGGALRVAKVYKEAQNRTFKNRSEYTEGRKTRNSRDARAMGKRSSYGRSQDEAAWRSTEVDVIRKLHSSGVRVPTPYHFLDGVLVMECAVDAEGEPAPRLADIVFEPQAAQAMYDHLIHEVMKMLCAGVVHGDLSDFNVLVGGDGPVIIDFPQSVDTAHNTNARRLLLRDVDNLHTFLRRFVPNARRLPYAEEMWDLHELNALTPETKLRGAYQAPQRRVNTAAVVDLIRDADYDERKRRDSLGLRGGPAAQPPHQGGRGPRPGPPRGDAPQPPQQQQPQPQQRVTENRPWRTAPPQNAPQQEQRGGPPRDGQRQGGPRPQQGTWTPRPDQQGAPPRDGQRGGPHPHQGGPHPHQGGPRPQQGGPHPHQGGPRNDQQRQGGAWTPHRGGGPRNEPQRQEGPRPQQHGGPPRQDQPRQDLPRQNGPQGQPHRRADGPQGQGPQGRGTRIEPDVLHKRPRRPQ